MGSSQSRAESSVDRIKRYSNKGPLKAAFGRSAEAQTRSGSGKSQAQETQVGGGCAVLSILSRLICGHLRSSSSLPNRHHHHHPTPRPRLRRNCCPRCPPLFPARCVVRVCEWIGLIRCLCAVPDGQDARQRHVCHREGGDPRRDGQVLRLQGHQQAPHGGPRAHGALDPPRSMPAAPQLPTTN